MIERILDRVEPRLVGGAYVDLLDSGRAMARTTFLLGLAATANLTGVGVVLAVLGEPSAAWAAFITALAYAAMVPYFSVTGNMVRAGGWVLLVSTVNNVAIHVLLGGFANSGAYLAWGILVCTYAAMSQTRRFTASITGLYAMTAIVLVFFESSLSGSRAAPDPLVPAILAADFLVATLLMLIPTLRQLLESLRVERARSERLLLNVLPGPIAERLKHGSGIIADAHEDCTVLFADIAGFTAHSRTIGADQLVGELNTIFTTFDELAENAGIEKIKTIGDGYMAVAGAPEPRPDHVEAACDVALAMMDSVDRVTERMGTDLAIRIGINTGPLVAGVIGTSKFSYDLWGDTVNLASRMESTGETGRIQVTQAVVDAVGDRYQFEPGGVRDVKGQGPTMAYFLVGHRRSGAG